MNAKSSKSSKTNKRRRTVPKSTKVKLSDLRPRKEPKGGFMGTCGDSLASGRAPC